jgi:D-alanyl-D-alanine carboxypeptidase (penicillin-binding protein 5/6)
MKVKLLYKNPVAAPVEKGAAIGRLVVSAPGRDPIELPVVAGATVERLGLFGRLSAAFEYLVWGKSGS